MIKHLQREDLYEVSEDHPTLDSGIYKRRINSQTGQAYWLHWKDPMPITDYLTIQTLDALAGWPQ